MKKVTLILAAISILFASCTGLHADHATTCTVQYNTIRGTIQENIKYSDLGHKKQMLAADSIKLNGYICY